MITDSILPVLVVVGLAATTVVLVLGLMALARKGGSGDPRSNRLMRLRVLFQAVTIGLLVLLAILYGTR